MENFGKFDEFTQMGEGLERNISSYNFMKDWKG
jgi:hypothetical protein